MLQLFQKSFEGEGLKDNLTQHKKVYVLSVRQPCASRFACQLQLERIRRSTSYSCSSSFLWVCQFFYCLIIFKRGHLVCLCAFFFSFPSKFWFNAVYLYSLWAFFSFSRLRSCLRGRCQSAREQNEGRKGNFSFSSLAQVSSQVVFISCLAILSKSGIFLVEYTLITRFKFSV